MHKKRLLAAAAAALLLAAATPAYAEQTPETAARAPIAESPVPEATVLAAGEVAINVTNFPDDSFRAFVTQYDTDGSGSFSAEEIAAVTFMRPILAGIKSLQGVEYFTALRQLHCANNELTELDVSHNTALTTLTCFDNRLTSLNVSGLGELESLLCYGNELTGLKLEGCTALKELYCEDNRLAVLDISPCPQLKTLNCTNNQLGALDISQSAALTVLYCYGNRLTALDISGCPLLATLECNGNKITALDLQGAAALNTLYLDGSPLAMLNLDGCTALKALAGDGRDPAAAPCILNTRLEAPFTEADGSWTLDLGALIGTANLARVTPLTPDGSFDAATGLVTFSAEPAQWQYAYDTKAGFELEFNVTIANAEAGVSAFVTRLYDVCLGRAPDEDGKADWVNQLTGYRISGSSAAYGFIFSEEFRNKNYSNADFVEHLYAAIMGRAPDEAGKADWVARLEGGATREEVFLGFANSEEFDNICCSYGIAAKGAETFVCRLYAVCLDRQPDEAGLADWAGRLRSGAVTGSGAASGFIFSEEFTGKSYSDDAFVTRLYTAFMGRTADSEGKGYWLVKLKDGASREEVFLGFANSAEFDNLCRSYGIQRG